MFLRKIFILLVLTLFIQCSKSQNISLESNDDGVISTLKDSHTEVNWETSSFSIYDAGKDERIKPHLTIRQKDDSTYQLRLILTNTGADSIVVEPHFPRIREWKFGGVEASDMYQLFPRQGEMANNADTLRYREVYSASFPFQFFDLSHADKGGLMIQVLDETNYPKKYYYRRVNSEFNFGTIYRGRSLSPGEVWELPTVEISVHRGDWHQAFDKYRNWLKGVLKPVSERKDWFRDVYNFRQTFLYDNGGEIGARNAETGKVDLMAKVDESTEAFGGVDYLHLFDWGQTPAHGRCGDYAPWDYLDKEELISQIKKVKARNIPVGLYHEGFLISPNSKVCEEYGQDWQMLTNKQERHDRFGTGYYYPCPMVPAWRDYLANTVARTSRELGVDGIYVDQYGFGWQYPCYNANHQHDVNKTSVDSELQIQGEMHMMRGIKEKVSSSIATYTEECSTDMSTQYQDGSFTYAISTARMPSRHNPSAVNLARFAFPDYKLIEILHIDRPVGDDIEGVKAVFFNGEGIWLSGPLTNPKWFPEGLKVAIRKCHAILREHKDAFRSLEPQPLVATLNTEIKANYFPTSNKCVWTFYNNSEDDYVGDVLALEVDGDAKYFDAWNNEKITPLVRDGKAIIRLEIKGKDVGCLIVTKP